LNRSLLVRADADHVQGTGHVMRTLALAQEWKDRRGSFTYVGRIRSESLHRRISEEGGEMQDLACDRDENRDRQVLLQRASSHSWAALDGYHFDVKDEGALRSLGCRILSIDDSGARTHAASDLVLNQNLSAESAVYQRGPDTIRLDGPRYVLLRRAFREGLRNLRERRTGGILVMFGGSDPAGLTARTLSAFAKLKEPPPAGVAICGPLDTDGENVRKAAAKLGEGWSVEMNASDGAVSAAQSNAELAVAACGSTIWELAAFGVPTLALSVAENQTPVLSSLAAIGVVADAGPGSSFREDELGARFDLFRRGADELRRMSQLGPAMVDGEGASRVVDAMLALEGSTEPRIRAAGNHDAFLLWRWANDPATRAQSFQTGPIEWDDHRRWLAQRLGSEACRIYILEWKTVPVGVVRYDRLEGFLARVSFSVDRDFRGRGFGLKLIEMSRPVASRDLSVDVFEAETLPGNVPSRRVFRRAGFFEQPSAGGDARRIRFLFGPRRNQGLGA